MLAAKWARLAASHPQSSPPHPFPKHLTAENCATEVQGLFDSNVFTKTADWVQTCLSYVREAFEKPDEIPPSDFRMPSSVPEDIVDRITLPGWRAAHALSLLLITLEKVEDVDDIADVFEFLNQVTDTLTAADAVGIIAVMLENVALLRLHFSRDDEENRQRQLMSKAVSISITTRLLQILKGTYYYGLWALKARFLLLACVPPSFDGVANKHRGREVPSVTKPLPVYPVSKYEEDVFEKEWKKAIGLRTALGLLPTTLTFTDFLMNVRIHRFLQEPSEYVSQVLLEGSFEPSRADFIDDDELEEGEENEDDEEVRATKSRQKQAERHLHSLEHVDVLWLLLEEIRHLISLFRVKSDTDALSKPFLATLWSQSAVSPLAFIEVMESGGSSILAYVAQSILILLKIHLEWPVRADETALLVKWAERINPQIIRAYKNLLRSIEDFTQKVPAADLDAARILLFHELGDLAQKYEGFKTFEQAEVNVTLPSRSDEQAPNVTRLTRITELGIPTLQSMTSMVDLNFQQYDLTANREEELFVSTPVPDNFESLPLSVKLRQRRQDYRERMTVDADPANEIEADEQLAAKCLNQWRILRSSFLSGTDDMSCEQVSPQIGLSIFLS